MMKMLAEHPVLFALESIAKDAGQVIMPFFRGNVDVREKPDGSPVTEADQTAEKLIIQRLAALWPEIPAVGEESASAEGEEVGRYRKYWLIDPLDGTRSFINRSDEFTVNIALVENGLPVLGVVYAPAKGVMYAGDVSLGSYKIEGEGKLERLSARSGTDELVVAVSKSHFKQEREKAFLERLKALYPVRIVPVGSSFKFCMVAEGKASVYFRSGTTMFWDTAAGHAVAKGAGACVRRWESPVELSYLDKTLTNPPFIVVLPEWEDRICAAAGGKYREESDV